MRTCRESSTSTASSGTPHRRVTRSSCSTAGSRRSIIYGDGGQTRDFTFVADVVQANIRAMESDTQGVFNVAGGRRISLNQLASMLSDLTGTRCDPIYEAPRAGDIRDSLADITRARKAFGYNPQYPVEEGLRQAVAWFRERA